MTVGQNTFIKAYICGTSDKVVINDNIIDSTNLKPIIRKASAHGLGYLIAPYGEDTAPIDISARHENDSRLGLGLFFSVWLELI